MNGTFPAPSPKAVEALNALMAYLGANNSLIDMGVWQDDGACGTTACLAGHATLKRNREHPELANASTLFQQEAREYLHLTNDEAYRLFHLAEWPVYYRQKYKATAMCIATIQAVFISTDTPGVEQPIDQWSPREVEAYTLLHRRLYHILADRVAHFCYGEDHA